MNELARNLLFWTGQSGRQYQLYPIGTNYYDVPGVYIFSKQGSDGRWYAVYIGETHNLKDRLTDNPYKHHRWQSI
jgi:hypothetical protein